jgi:hypothetical protein
VDKQATGRARTGPGVTIDSGRLSGSQGVTTLLKVTALPAQEKTPQTRPMTMAEGLLSMFLINLILTKKVTIAMTR